MYPIKTRQPEKTTRLERAAQATFCPTGVLERPRYFPRQLMTPDELILEQDYFRDKLRRHNRLLHGWGVVCGAIVCRFVTRTGNGSTRSRTAAGLPCPEVDDPTCLDPWVVTVSPGYILGPYGDEILIDCTVEVDVRKACTSISSGGICPPAPDPWCSDVNVERSPGPIYLAVRYTEMNTRPVRVQPNGCGCDDTACEYSRIRDGFEICALEACPVSHRDDPPTELACELSACPPCPDEPWVVLARVDVTANGIQAIDNYNCRRMVISYAAMWCRPEQPDAVGTEEEEERRERETGLDQEQIELAIRRLRPHLTVREEELRESPRGLAEIAERRAVDLRGVKSSSPLGNRLEAEKVTIGRAASMKRDEFIRFATEGIDPRIAARTRNQAAEVWERARAVMETIKTLEPA